MADFTPPLLLAGPVLRQVTATSVSVWIATSQACSATLDIFTSIVTAEKSGNAQTGTIAETPLGSGQRNTVQLGVALHLAVVTAHLADASPDSLHSYNVTLEITGSAAAGAGLTGTWDLSGLGLLQGQDPSTGYSGGLGYLTGQLPSFASPPSSVSQLRLIHGSCYKMHGAGPSMLSNLDDRLREDQPADSSAAKKRPHVLMLTGDQIYADDVATALLPILTTLGAQLLGGGQPENIAIDDAVGSIPVTQENLPAGRRRKLIRASAGMTSDDCDNHLIGLGEWAALYLLGWTGRAKQLPGATTLWPDSLAILAKDGDPPGQQGKVLNRGGPKGLVEQLLTPVFDGVEASRLTKLKADFGVDGDAVTSVSRTGDLTRRALANIPTLTICDDHEVTDDWFISGAWRKRVLASPLGRAMLRNALMAYVLFQGWGNMPDRFATTGTPEAQFLDLVPQLFGGVGGAPDPGVCAQMDALLGLDADADGGDDPNHPTRIQHHYHLDIAGSRLVVLDTRTHRDYASENGPPGLLNSAALDAQLPVTLTDDLPLMIVVSPAPVLGPRVIEEIAVPLGTRTLDLIMLASDKAKEAAEGVDRKSPLGDLYLDVESWSAMPASFQRLLDRITRCPRVVILAGDVHYGASFALDYTRFPSNVPPGQDASQSPPSHASSRIVHFTSSAFRNSWDPLISTVVNSIGIAENVERLGMSGAMLGWKKIVPPVLAAGSVTEEARPLRARLAREPVLLPTNGWREAHPVRPVEWMYRITPISDTRSDDERLSYLVGLGAMSSGQVLGAAVPDVSAPPFDQDASSSWVGAGGPYSVATALHAANLESGVVTRTLVFANNLGVVTFSGEGDSLTVQMKLYFVRAHPAQATEGPSDYVIHQASLAVNALPAPASVGS
jgi:hypothetical protein